MRTTFDFMSYIQYATTRLFKVQTPCAAEVMNVPFHQRFSSLLHLICRKPTVWRTQYHRWNLRVSFISSNRPQMIPQRGRAQIASISHTHPYKKSRHKLVFQSNLPLCWPAGRAVIWDKLGSLCRAECTAFLKSWVSVKHKRKYLAGAASFLSLSVCSRAQMR